jgi:hypothetical protein
MLMMKNGRPAGDEKRAARCKQLLTISLRKNPFVDF